MPEKIDQSKHNFGKRGKQGPPGKEGKRGPMGRQRLFVPNILSKPGKTYPGARSNIIGQTWISITYPGLSFIWGGVGKAWIQIGPATTQTLSINVPNKKHTKIPILEYLYENKKVKINRASADIDQNPGNGNVKISQDKKFFLYSPHKHYFGMDSFTYQVRLSTEFSISVIQLICISMRSTKVSKLNSIAINDIHDTTSDTDSNTDSSSDSDSDSDSSSDSSTSSESSSDSDSSDVPLVNKRKGKLNRSGNRSGILKLNIGADKVVKKTFKDHHQHSDDRSRNYPVIFNGIREGNNTLILDDFEDEDGEYRSQGGHSDRYSGRGDDTTRTTQSAGSSFTKNSRYGAYHVPNKRPKSRHGYNRHPVQNSYKSGLQPASTSFNSFESRGSGLTINTRRIRPLTDDTYRYQKKTWVMTIDFGSENIKYSCQEITPENIKSGPYTGYFMTKLDVCIKNKFVLKKSKINNVGYMPFELIGVGDECNNIKLGEDEILFEGKSPAYPGRNINEVLDTNGGRHLADFVFGEVINYIIDKYIQNFSQYAIIENLIAPTRDNTTFVLSLCIPRNKTIIDYYPCRSQHDLNSKKCVDMILAAFSCAEIHHSCIRIVSESMLSALGIGHLEATLTMNDGTYHRDANTPVKNTRTIVDLGGNHIKSITVTYIIKDNKLSIEQSDRWNVFEFGFNQLIDDTFWDLFLQKWVSEKSYKLINECKSIRSIIRKQWTDWFLDDEKLNAATTTKRKGVNKELIVKLSIDLKYLRKHNEGIKIKEIGKKIVSDWKIHKKDNSRDLFVRSIQNVKFDKSIINILFKKSKFRELSNKLFYKSIASKPVLGPIFNKSANLTGEEPFVIFIGGCSVYSIWERVLKGNKNSYKNLLFPFLKAGEKTRSLFISSIGGCLNVSYPRMIKTKNFH